MSLLLAASGDIASGVVEPEGVDFDGVNDYLSRSSDLTGNVDSKTFTFSCWVYLGKKYTSGAPNLLYNYGGSAGSVEIDILGSSPKGIRILGYNSAGTLILDGRSSLVHESFINTWANVLISIDMSSTTKRHIFLNDIDITNTVTWATFINDTLDFTSTTWRVANGLQCRMEELFRDYTYRDLSIEANRRLFIDNSGKPTPTATLKALNPILYLPLKDAATAHINEGTGGNFVQNGTLDTASRGANQDNCVASYFDGTADYLRKDNIVATSSYIFLINTVFSTKNTSSRILHIGTTTTSYAISLQYDISGYIYLLARNSSNTDILQISFPVTQSKNNSLSISCDMQDQSKLRITLNGKIINPTITTFILGQINIVSGSTDVTIGSRIDNTIFFNGNIGELYFDTRYADLATNNPFWDSVANRPKPVRQVIRDNPELANGLIIMPLDASNAGKNYGTGGNFTANSAPYVGARGGSEFWARSVKSNLIAGSNLSNTSNLGGVADGKTFSAVVIAKHNDWTYPLVTFNGATENICLAMSTTGAVYSKEAATSNYNLIMSMSGFVNGAWNIGFISVDLTDTNKTFTYLNGTTTTAKNTFVNSNIGFSETTVSYVGKSSTDAIQGENAYVYFTTDYIDFSQEANRLKFIDGLGYPKDLKAQIDAGVIPKPLIYLPFSDPINLGKNLGTGGDFTVNGTVTQGADVNG